MGSQEPTPAPNRPGGRNWCGPATGSPPPPPPEPPSIYGPLELVPVDDRKTAVRCFTELLNMTSINGGIMSYGTEATQNARAEAVRHLARQLLGDIDFEILT